MNRPTLGLLRSYNHLATLLAIFLFLLQQPQCLSDVIRLNSNNFDEHVFQDTNPWIVGIREKISDDELEEVYNQVKDRINIGAIDEKEYVTLLRDLVS